MIRTMPKALKLIISLQNTMRSSVQNKCGGSVTSYNKLLKTESDYNEALKRIEELFDAESGTTEADELELLVALVELYEKEHFPIEAPDPVSAIKFRMEQEGLTNEDMVQYLGSKSRVSEVFSHKRNLSISMIRKLVTGLHVPAEILLGASVIP